MTTVAPPPDRLAELLVALHARTDLDRAALYRLAEEIGAWTADPSAPAARLAREIGIPAAQLEKARAALADAPAAAARERARAEEIGARLVTRLDPDYPAALAELPLAPPVLSVRGELPAGPAIAIVGSRRADPYGVEVARLFASALAEHGVTIVSGFARGVDAAAHRGALDVGAGRTVAILGCGLGVDYPRGHARLGDDIAGRGALLSELPCDAGPRAWHFPVRNRLIAALSSLTLVVQAAARSGSLSTARWALELGRDVFAVPGRIFDERSLGPHALLSDGAGLAQHPRDLIEALGGIVPIETRPEPEPEPPPGLGGALLGALPRGATRAPEDLAAATGATVDRVLAALLELEISGFVARRAGGVYERA